MRVLFSLFSLLAAALFLNSCGEYACTKASLQFGLIGFSDAEADTIVIKSFEKGNPQRLVDSVAIDDIYFTRSGDTLKMAAYSSATLLESQFDYEIFFPGSGQLLLVTGIEEEQRYLKRKGIFGATKEGCENHIQAYQLNGRVKTVPEYNRAYFTK